MKLSSCSMVISLPAFFRRRADARISVDSPEPNSTIVGSSIPDPQGCKRLHLGREPTRAGDTGRAMMQQIREARYTQSFGCKGCPNRHDEPDRQKRDRLSGASTF